MKLREDISRMVIRQIIRAGQEKDFTTLNTLGISLQEAHDLRTLSPVDLENIVRNQNNSTRLVNIRIDRDSLFKRSHHRQSVREIRKAENDLIKRLILAQCSNRILHTHFGLSSNDASKLRKLYDTHSTGRPRSLTQGEENEVHLLLDTGPYDLTNQTGVLECCLSIQSLLEAPFKHIYSVVYQVARNGS